MHNPVTVRRFEALSVFTLCLLVYDANGFSWGMFALLFFTPDLAMFGYAISKSFGNRLYNTTHFFVFPVVLFFLVYFYNQAELLPYALIWASHIAFDRLLGWGLKTESFYHTDMGDKKIPERAGFLRP